MCVRRQSTKVSPQQQVTRITYHFNIKLETSTTNDEGRIVFHCLSVKQEASLSHSLTNYIV